MSQILIIGASAGIGQALVEEYLDRGHTVGALARRESLLQQQFGAHPRCHCGYLDVNAPDAADRALAFAESMGGVDICIITAGIGHVNKDLDWEIEEKTIQTNVLGFSRLALAFYHYFRQKEKVRGLRGQLVGISSIAGVRGLYPCPGYSASKGYTALFLQSLRWKSNKEKLGIKVSTVIPGFVDTGLIAGNEYLFWVVPVKKAARQIYRGIARKRARIFVCSFLSHYLPISRPSAANCITSQTAF